MPNLNYIIAAGAILLFSLGLIFLPEKVNKKELEPDQLLLELQSERRFISVDQITDRLINDDPSLILVDVRDSLEYANFSLPKAMNMPLEEVLDPKYDNYFGREELDIIFFSNDDYLAEKAWILKKRQDPNPMYILKGGLNQWTADILLSEEPTGAISEEEREKYAFRYAARKYFVGTSTPIIIDPKKTAALKAKQQPKRVVIAPPKKVEKKRRLEGC
jgi:rhodanese-related sulfurtransferase